MSKVYARCLSGVAYRRTPVFDDCDAGGALAKKGDIIRGQRYRPTVSEDGIDYFKCDDNGLYLPITRKSDGEQLLALHSTMEEAEAAVREVACSSSYPRNK